jgi:hypothetical protein
MARQLSPPINLRLHPEQLHWLDAQTLRGLSRADAIRLCIWAAMDRGALLQHEHSTPNTQAASTNQS